LVAIPSIVCFIAANAFDPECQISLLDGSFCPEFERWSAVRGRDSNVDFKRIQSLGSGLCGLSDSVVDLSGFEGDDAISGSGTGSRQLFDRMDETAKFGERPLSAPMLTFSKVGKILQASAAAVIRRQSRDEALSPGLLECHSRPAGTPRPPQPSSPKPKGFSPAVRKTAKGTVAVVRKPLLPRRSAK
jgi:hypothetical protein